jgi:hypothetical protein
MTRNGIPIIALCLAWGCSGDDAALPTAASGDRISDPAFSLSSPSNLAASTVSGVVTDAVRGEPLAGITVEIPGVISATTTHDGAFTLAAPGMGSVPLLLHGDAVHTRETHALLSPRPAEIDVLPLDDDFDLGFFDHVFRNLGESHTERWTVEPRFEIWTSVYERVEGDFYGDFVATDDQAPERFVTIARDVIAADAPKYTGGFIQGLDVVVLPPHDPGTRLTYKEYFKAFTISVFVFKGEDFSAGPSWAYESGRIYSASIWMLKQSHKDDRQVFSHELAHTLGFSHPQGIENVPRPSIMRNAEDVTPHDVLHGRILYRRPPGSRTADRDPESYVINALRDAVDMGPPDPTRIRWVRN